MNMIKIYARTPSSKIGVTGVYYQTKLTYSEILKSTFAFCNLQYILECCNPRFLNKTEIAIQKYNHLDVIHKLPTVKTEDV